MAVHTPPSLPALTLTRAVSTLAKQSTGSSNYFNLDIAAWQPVRIARPTKLMYAILSPVQVLIYNAGVLRETMQTKLPDVTAQMLTDTFATNTIGPLLVTQALAKQVSTRTLLHRQLVFAVQGLTAQLKRHEPHTSPATKWIPERRHWGMIEYCHHKATTSPPP